MRPGLFLGCLLACSSFRKAKSNDNAALVGGVQDVVVWPPAEVSSEQTLMEATSRRTSSTVSPDCELPNTTGNVLYSSECNHVTWEGALSASFDIQVDSGSWAVAISFLNSGGTDDEIKLFVNNGHNPANWQLWRNAGTSIDFSTGSGFVVGTQYSIQFSVDETGTMNWWRDNVLMGTKVSGGSPVSAAQRTIAVGRGAAGGTKYMTGSVTNIKLWNSDVFGPTSTATSSTATTSTSTSSTTSTPMPTSTLTWTLLAGMTPPDCRFFGGEVSDPVFFDYTTECPLVWDGAFTMMFNMRVDVTTAVTALALFVPPESNPTDMIALVANQDSTGRWRFISHSLSVDVDGFSVGVDYAMQWTIDADGSMNIWRDGVLVGTGGGAGSIVTSGTRNFYVGRGDAATILTGAITNIMVWNSAPCDLPQNNCPTTSTTTSSSSSSSSRSTTSTATATTTSSSMTTSRSTTTSTTSSSTGTTTSSVTVTTSVTATTTSSVTHTSTSTSSTSSESTTTSSSSLTTSATSTDTTSGTTTTSTSTTGTVTTSGTTTTSTSATDTTTGTTTTSTSTTSTDTTTGTTTTSTSATDTTSSTTTTSTSTTGTDTTTGTTTTSTSATDTTSGTTTTSTSATGTSTTTSTSTSTSTTSSSQTSSVTSTTTASSTTSTTSTRTRTATTTDTVTAVPGLTTTTLSPPERVEATVWAAVSNILQQGLADGENATAETTMGTIQVFTLGALGDGTSAVPTQGGIIKVAASAALVAGLPADAVLSLLGIGGGVGSQQTDLGLDPFVDPFANASGGVLVTRSLDISVCTPSNCTSVTLDEPLLFRLPDLPGGATTPGDQKCAFITEPAPGEMVWSTEGLTRATAAQILAIGEDPNDGIWCATMHLSIFGAIFNLVAGCTNIELFTPAGLQAITENEGWYRSNAAGITFFILCLLVSVAIAADVVECWRFRYGKTQQPGKSMKLCSNFLAWGPQLVKHKYAMFVVYARDVIACVRSGHSKLKNASLLSSVQRFLAAQTHISVACVTAHCWNGAGWLETPASLPHIVVSHKLRFHGHVAEDVIRKYLTGISPCKVILRFVITCWAVHPLVDSTRLGPGSVTVHKRTALQVAGIVGVVATNAMIFNFSGEMRSWEADATCPISPSSLWFIVVATLVSVSVNAVPNAFLMDVAKQVHGHPGWIAIFWMLWGAYLIIGLTFLASLLANLNTKEQDKWYKALEWSMSFKLVGMPLAQGLRHWLMLELFLVEDAKGKESHFNTSMGFKHPAEIPTTDKGKEAAELMAKSAISLEELLIFAAMLGDKVMPEYNPEKSTSEEVLLNAIRPLCVKAPQSNYPLQVEVVELYGLDIPHSNNSKLKLSCSVHHLGHKVGGHRLCLLEERSGGVTANENDSMMRYAWNFKASVDGVKLEHAIGFAVHEGTRVLGIAWLPVKDLVERKGHNGEVRLLPLGSSGAPEKGKIFCEPSEASPVPAHNVLTGSNRSSSVSELSISELTRLVVKVNVSDLCLKSLALQELNRVKELRPDHPSEMPEGIAADLRKNLVKLGLDVMNDERATYSSTAYCEPSVHFDSNSTNNSKGGDRPYVAPRRIVVHSWKGLFSHLVAMVTSDALAMEDGYNVVSELAQKLDYHTILDLLVEKGCQGHRYWIDLFAIDPANVEMKSNHNTRPATPKAWHEGLLTALPTLFRDIRRNSCVQMATDLEEENKAASVPVIQLLILDRKFHFLHESNCLAEMMLAKSMRFRQRLILHPKHLKGGILGEELNHLADKLGDAPRPNELPWTKPFLEDKQAVYDTVKDLAVESVKEMRKDDASTWMELSMTNLTATVVGDRAGQSTVLSRARHGGDATGADDLGAMEDGDVDVD